MHRQWPHLNILVHHLLGACFECRHTEDTQGPFQVMILILAMAASSSSRSRPSSTPRKPSETSLLKSPFLVHHRRHTWASKRSLLAESAQRPLPAVVSLTSGTSSVPSSSCSDVPVSQPSTLRSVKAMQPPTIVIPTLSRRSMIS